MTDLFVSLSVALGLGLIVGFQRERAEESLAGFRTFPLITLAGALAGHLGIWLGAGWIVSASLLALTTLVVMGNLARWRSGRSAAGITTEMAALVMFLVGTTAALGHVPAAVAVGGVVAVLLHFKRPMHALARRLSDDEVRAVMRIVVIGLVILPVLPDRSYGPYEVLNPFRIWLMVVLIVGISVTSYVVYKLADARVGTLLGGILGGFISSTATTASYARHARERSDFAPAATVVLMVSSTVVFVRIFIELAAVAPDLLLQMAGPLLAMTLANTLLSAAAFWIWGRSVAGSAEQRDPSELKAALVFGVLYGVVIFAVAAAKEHLGDAGLYAVAAVSGLTDVDAITLSVANLAETGSVETRTAWRAVLIAALSNLVFKGALAAALGGAPLLRRVGPLFACSLAAGVAILVAWP
jgi:uncharacterized membrane protein (DUF4010 family)